MRQIVKIVAFITILCGVAACTKSLDAPLPIPVKGIRDSAANIRSVLRTGPYTLFYQAFTRAGLDSPYAFYTVFAPSDSAMTAAGLTSAVINSLSLDSLYTLIGYHISLGVLPEATLRGDTSTVRLPTLEVTTGEAYNFFNQYGPATLQACLFVSEKDVLYVNGSPVGKAEAGVEASNGWVYPVNRVLFPPARTVWNFITSRPELSMYVEANWLVDSMNAASGFYNAVPDSVLFNTAPYDPVDNFGEPSIHKMITVIAPTNDAFARAGFNTADDLRQYIGQSVPSPYSTPPTYNAMDSVLKTHYLCNPGQSTVFYQDMLNSPDINDGWMNTNPALQLERQALLTAFPDTTMVMDHFSVNGGVVQVQWNPNVPAAALPFSAGTSFTAVNGAVYEIDQLFYPHN